ncbi:hypothetical protein V5P93_002158 [Actinokineospora auranticolor]|uniref:Uncharacterized protein n=1 Tax=Actinokineospora auranticolor TaxID=155976 RepID=A0A2S6GBT8_9PSEU|nr:hypothetical protein [Actinokineospora auranticolor]PPK60997.1 hypothetical protein CLV40_14511 [Actinokineospora auranticolor]
MAERLGHKQTAVVLTLLSLAREVSNPELQGLVGFTLDGKDRVRLNDLQLVDSHKDGRRYVHKLTDTGKRWCIAEFGTGTPPLPPARSVLAPALYIFLGGVGRFLERKGLKLDDVFAPEVGVSPEEIEDRVRTAYRELAVRPRATVRLADLRPRLGGAATEDVDAVLKRLSRDRQVSLVPDSDRKALTDADHAAAVRIGGEDQHLIAIETS